MNILAMNVYKLVYINRDIRKVKFRHNRASNTELGMKILQNEITGTQISFCTNFCDKLSVILSFLSLERLHCCYKYFHCFSCTTTTVSVKPCALNAEFQHFILRFNKIALLCGYD